MAESASAGTLFDVLWDAIADVMGNAATATLLRRASRRVCARDNTSRLDLGALVIAREGLEYQYQLPPSWSDPRLHHDAVCALVVELQPLLTELTGHVVLRRLAMHRGLRECGLPNFEEDA